MMNLNSDTGVSVTKILIDKVYRKVSLITFIQSIILYMQIADDGPRI